MPCNADYMNPSAKEEHSRQVAELIIYINENKLGKHFDNIEIYDAASSIYGNVSILDEMTKTLCELCREHYANFELDINDKHDRELADWWSKHQKADAERTEKEQRIERERQIRDSALNKLTPEERAVLGF